MRRSLFTFMLFLSLQSFSQSGIVWMPAMDIAPNSFDNNHPRITLDANEDPLVIWGDLPDIARFSRWTGSSFSTPVALNPASLPVFVYNWAGPDIASRGDTVYTVFKHDDVDSNYVYVMSSFDGGSSFGVPHRVDFYADSLSDFPTIAIDQFGQPLVAYMRMDSGYVNIRWVVSRSTDYGVTFLPDVVASGASGTEICDCCPASLVISGSDVALLYRPNISNIRDNWVSFSNDDGSSFPNGMNIDQHNWILMSCPSSGPDGVIVDDTLYSIFMNGSTGSNRLYTNKNHIGTFTSSPAVPLTGTIAGLSQQNYGRIANYGTAVAQVWKQVISGSAHLSLLFTENIHSGFPAAFDTVASGGGSTATNGDVAVSSDAVHVVWQNDATGTIKYRKGFFGPAGIQNLSVSKNHLFIYPNPVSDRFFVEHSLTKKAELVIYGIAGNVLSRKTVFPQDKISIDTETFDNGSYYLSISDGEKVLSQNFIVLH